jgi:dienelactone hydrolase
MTRQRIFWSGLVFLLFLGALAWAKEQDAFIRKWFTLKTADHVKFKCVVILPKPVRQYPVVIYVHGFGGNLMNDGNDLRQMAESGLATVSLEYDQTNVAAFAPQFEAVLRYLGRQKWADTNSIAWVGFSLGANRILDFALQHSQPRPQLFVQLSGAGLVTEPGIQNPEPKLYCSILLVHGDQDEIFPVTGPKRLASLLQSNGVPVELKIIPGLPHGMEPERGVVFRCIGEYCLTHLTGKGAWQNYHSTAQWQTEAPALWVFWLSAAAWVIGWFARWRYRWTASPKRSRRQRHEIALRWLAVLLAIFALAETAIQLVTPHFSISDKILTIARHFLVQPKERADFESLAAQSIWQGKKLRTLLEHVKLAGYNRELVNWQVNDTIYLDFVLSPIITGTAGEQFNWRRPLWEEFYPYIRHESSPDDAAKIIVRHLRERVTIVTLQRPPHDVPVIWLRQISDNTGFEIIYIAALRSVGIAARLDDRGQAEFFSHGGWQPAPQPIIANSLKL